MIESYPLVTTLVISIVVAFLFGLLANRLHLPTILGYLIAGMMIGPNTPGFVANAAIAEQLAEIGVILLMFGVGLHFSLDDLKKVRRIALPGAIIQMSVTTVICLIVATLLGHKFAESLVFGITLSVASTVVLMRALEQYKMIDLHVGKVAIGWLIVEDIAMVITLVLLPVLIDMASKDGINFPIISKMVGLIIFKIAAFIAIMIIFGKKLLPRLLIAISRTKSRELMVLGTIAISSGFAFVAYTLFGASFALGSFMAGFVLNESAIGRKSAEKAMPLRDIFSVLFFVSAGMLFNPEVLIKEPILVFVAFILITIGKAGISYLIMSAFRQSFLDRITLAVSLSQIGEFSFILAALALKLGVFSNVVYDMVIASAIISITINPFLFKALKVAIKNHK